jgi:phosphomannomutase
MNNTIVLFDMDGTLTEPRGKFDSKALDLALYSLTNLGIHIGIVTGSGLNYLRQQMGDFLDRSPSRYKTHLLPCNGTKYLAPPSFANQGHTLTHNVSMVEKLGAHEYRLLIKQLIEQQAKISNHAIPLSGHFIDYRGSMVNWCPIGREASTEQRREFVNLDNELKLRTRELEIIREKLNDLELGESIVIKLGGDTSFDVYPSGWDKTYALRHFKNWNIWFVGDRCGLNGNDYEIYKACDDQSYITDGPQGTEKIIKEIIRKTRGE